MGNKIGTFNPVYNITLNVYKPNVFLRVNNLITNMKHRIFILYHKTTQTPQLKRIHHQEQMNVVNISRNVSRNKYGFQKHFSYFEI